MAKWRKLELAKPKPRMVTSVCVRENLTWVNMVKADNFKKGAHPEFGENPST